MIIEKLEFTDMKAGNIYATKGTAASFPTPMKYILFVKKATMQFKPKMLFSISIIWKNIIAELAPTTKREYGYSQSDGLITDVITLKNKGIQIPWSYSASDGSVL